MNGAATVHLPRVPTSPTHAIGREHEIAALVQSLREGQQRLVTLTGPGGVGKSALALTAGAKLAPDVPAIGYVDFGAIGRNEDPADHLGRVLRPGIPTTGGTVDDLADLLNPLGESRQTFLLIWDSFEHLVHRAGFAADLLSACPQLTLLVTSRTPLRIRGEREFPVPPLAVPLPDAEPSALAAQPPAAVALFVERARAARYEFALTAANAADIGAIVRRLDGIPLAIELAATRVKLLPPAALLRQLDARPDLLSCGPRDAPGRQQTLRNTVAWSYDLLDDPERAVFRRVATIPGDWPLDAALAVADSAGLTPDGILHALSSLIEHHLVDRVNASADGVVEPRFSMRDSIRSFGLDAATGAAEVAEAHRRHASWVLATAEAAARHLAGPDQAHWLDQLERERTGLVAAQRWLAESGHHAESLRLATALARFWSVRGHREEERTLLASALATASPEIDPPLQVRALRVLGNLWYDQGHCEEARSSYLAALDLLGSDQIGAEHANLWSNLTLIDLESGDLDQGVLRLHDVIAVRRALNQPRSLGHDLNLLGEILLAQGQIGAAIEALDEALGVLTETGDLRLLAVCLALRGEAARRTRDLPRAHDSLHRGLALAREIGDSFAAAAALGQLARLAEDQGDPETALGLYHDALVLRFDQGDLASARPLVDGLARCVRTYAPDLAAALNNAAVHGPSDVNSNPGPWLPDEILAAIADLRQALQPATAGEPEGHPVDDTTPEDAPSPPLISTFRLSKREIEVLRLLASGITDREIAEALAISQRTATWHVTNVYDKLGVNSRLEAGIVAAQQGLV